ncbi:DUF1768 domain-containing protein [Paenibacillus sp. LMG 31457]|uniref:DUF1768 domain-containing protein n=2 Tax=Paenibacillus planticolens TaxID=2654976 RepID=A0ABX1ZER4_9BACL|nr:DUF1768 domain-containing protein [Paenibacillus planticolens]
MIEENKKRMKELKPEERFIRFYESNKPYGCFSNFAKYSIVINNKEWATNEHYFQAQKYVGTEYEEEIRLASTPMEAAKLGRDRKKPLRNDWEECKVQIMRDAIIAKVDQHENIKSILLSTGNCTIIEHTINDSYWGDGANFKGQNMLGKLLMEVRNSLEGYVPEFFLPQWIAFPEILPFSIGWRMGAGEDYLMYLSEWRKKQTSEALKEYDEYFTPPEEWIEARKVREAIKNKFKEEK